MRVWLGWQGLEAGLGKIFSPVWTGEKAGVAVGGFLQGALAKATGEHPFWLRPFVSGIFARIGEPEAHRRSMRTKNGRVVSVIP
ncbi:MAG: hypothetical protein ACM3TT_11615 [Syntrophothermus sp.]